jgi:predicted nucleic acid-binding protein
MARLIFLDSGPLWLAASARGKSQADACRTWLWGLWSSGARIFVPEIADYEVRREWEMRGAAAGLGRLDRLKARLVYLPITTRAMLQAARLWALVRRQGMPTAAPEALDADCILAGQVLTESSPGDLATVATVNMRHLNRFPGLDAQPWQTVL